VHKATGLAFHASIPSTSPMGQRAALRVIKAWLAEFPYLISSIEGPNEPDMDYAVKLGATLQDSAEVQQAAYKIGRAAGVAVAQMSVGFGWFPPFYEGNYKKFGKPPADLGNAHVYMQTLHPPILPLDKIGKLAAWSVDDKPIMVTEFGVHKSPQQTDDEVSAFMHIAPFTSYMLGHDSLYVYALHDDDSNTVGFYDAKGNKRAFADYWHITARLLADPKGKNLPPKELGIRYGVTLPKDKLYGIRHASLYKSDGSVWVAVYQENKLGAAEQTETVSFERPYPVIAVIDGRTGEVVEQQENAQSQSLVLPANHLFFVVAAPNITALRGQLP
jgi:hypothetical protein